MVIALKLALLGSYYAIDGIYSWDTVIDNYMLLIPLILFPEGFINGVTMTLLVVYKPEWVIPSMISSTSTRSSDNFGSYLLVQTEHVSIRVGMKSTFSTYRQTESA